MLLYFILTKRCLIQKLFSDFLLKKTKTFYTSFLLVIQHNIPGYYIQDVSQDFYLNEGDLVGWMSHEYNGGVIDMQLSLQNVFGISGNFAELDEILCYPSLSIIKGNQHVLTVVVEIPSYYEVPAGAKKFS